MVDTHEKEIKTLEKRLKKQPGSPLFARLADYYLEEGRTDDALRVCKEGLTHHPYYTTGHLLKARALVALGKKEEARKSFNTVHELRPGIDTIENLLADLGGPIDSGTPTVSQATKPSAPHIQAEEVQSLESVGTETPPALDVSELTPEAHFTPVAEPPTEQQQSPATVPAAEETQEEFMTRMHQELAGTENTLSLEDYLSGNHTSSSQQSAPAQTASNNFEDLADKLQGAKITPVIDLSRQSDDSGGASAGFVTPTLAEIYVKQGWYDDAIKAYHSLAASKPEQKDVYEARIKEIERMKQEQQ